MPRGKSTSKHVKHIKRTKKHVGRRKRLSQIRHRGGMGMFGNNQPTVNPATQPTGNPAIPPAVNPAAPPESEKLTFYEQIFGKSKPNLPAQTYPTN